MNNPKEIEDAFKMGWEYGIKGAIDVAKNLKDSQLAKQLWKNSNLNPKQIEGFNYAMNLLCRELNNKLNVAKNNNP